MEIIITSSEIQFPSLGKTFTQNTTISVAANMREALSTLHSSLFTLHSVAEPAEVSLITVNSPVIIVPEEQLQDEDPTALYNLSITQTDEDSIIVQQVTPPFGGVGGGFVALFAISKDLNTVIEDHFPHFQYQHIAIQHLHSSGGTLRPLEGVGGPELEGAFIDGFMYAYAFKKGRLHFFNSYPANSAHDCAYLLLSIWKQLGYNQLKDQLHLSGEVSFMEELKEILSEFIKNVK